MAKTIHINNRRYLGNKYRLLPFIKSVVKKECKNVNTVVDIFAGTGVVASAFPDKHLVASFIDDYNSSEVQEENYMTQLELYQPLAFEHLIENLNCRYRKSDIAGYGLSEV